MPEAIHRYMDGREIDGFPAGPATMAQAAMSKRALAWIVVALAGLLSTAGLLFFMFGTSKLIFSEAEVQERLNNKLPRAVRDMTIERMVARLADNRLTLRVEVKGTVLRQPIAAVVTARGVPRYEAQKGEMFFDADDVKLDQLTVAGRSVAGEEDAADAQAPGGGRQHGGAGSRPSGDKGLSRISAGLSSSRRTSRASFSRPRLWTSQSRRTRWP